MQSGRASALPHEWEWQLAPQGADGRAFPWGNQWQDDAVPTPAVGRTMRGADPVDAHPLGASPYGVMDMVGTYGSGPMSSRNEHTRRRMCAGAVSPTQPQGLDLVFPLVRPYATLSTASCF